MFGILETLRLLDVTLLWCVAFCGLYARWKIDNDWSIIIGATVPAVGSIGVAILTWLKRRQSNFVFNLIVGLAHFWPAYLIGTTSLKIGLPSSLTLDLSLIYHILFCISIAIHITYISTSRAFSDEDLHSLKTEDLVLLLGLASSVFMLPDSDSLFGLLCCIGHILLVILSLRKKSPLCALMLPLYFLLLYKTFINDQRFEEFQPSFNWTGPMVVIINALIDPLTCYCVGKRTMIELCQPLLNYNLCSLRLGTVGVLVLETTALIVTGLTLNNHKEWWVIIPIYSIISAVVWAPLHSAYFLTMWKMTKRLHACNQIYKENPSRSLRDIMASRGIRHFALIVYPLMWLNLIFTIVPFLISWTTRAPITCGLFLLCLPVQFYMISYLREIANKLGGTSCGCAIVTPAVAKRSDNENMKEVHTSVSYATRTVSLIQKFFLHHLIEEGGCEYSTEPYDMPTLRNKLSRFFSTTTRDGQLFDSYVVYYSGPVNDQGDWMLKDQTLWTYADMLDLWQNSPGALNGRLIMVCDTAKSNYWIAKVRTTSTAHVALQTLYVRREAEMMNEFSVGDFTREWVEFNTNPSTDIYSGSFRSPIVVTYGISRYWHSFHFNEPSVEDMDKNWKDNFSVSIRPIIQLIKFFDGRKCCRFYHQLANCFVMCAMSIWPPDQLDIGHGFKLVRFFRLPKGSSLF